MPLHPGETGAFDAPEREDTPISQAWIIFTVFFAPFVFSFAVLGLAAVVLLFAG